MDPANGGTPPSLTRRRRLLSAALVVGCITVWAVAALVPIPPTDLEAFFWPSARMAVLGHPLLPYAPAGQALYPNANGPLALVPLAFIGVVLNVMGAMESLQLRRAFTYAVAAVFFLLMAREGVRAVERMRGRRFDPRSRLLLYGALTLGPTLWQGAAGYGHVEQPIEMWLVLLAARSTAERKVWPAGLALGLACLARSSAALFTVPLAMAAWRSGGLSRALRLSGAAIGTAALGLLPFYIADSRDLIHSLVTYRGELPVGGGSVWSLLRGTPLEIVGQRADLLFVLALVVTLNVWLTSGSREHEPGDRLYVALAVTAMAYALMAKTLWPYYLVEAYVLLLVWLAGRPHRLAPVARFAPAALVTSLAMVGEIGVLANQSLLVIRVEGAFMFGALGALTLWTASRALHQT